MPYYDYSEAVHANKSDSSGVSSSKFLGGKAQSTESVIQAKRRRRLVLDIAATKSCKVHTRKGFFWLQTTVY